MSKALVRLWEWYVSGGMPDVSTSDTKKIVHFINIFSLTGTIAVFLFGLLNFSTGDRFVGTVELVLGVLAFSNALLMRRTRHPELAANVLLGIVLVLMIVLLITGGVDRTGIYWFPLFPTMAFFLRGKKAGVLWYLALMACSLATLLLFQMNVLSLAYTPVEIRQLFVSLSVLSLFIYLYFEYIREHELILLEQNEHELRRTNDELQKKIAALKVDENRQHQMIETIDKTITQIQTKNQDLENSKLAMTNILEDLSIEKRLTEESQRKDEALLESIGEGMIATDANGTIILANTQAEALLGYSVRQMIDKPYTDIVQPIDTNGVLVPVKDRPMSIAMATGKPASSTNYQYQRKDKTLFPVAITASPIESNGKRIGGIVVFRDITKEKQIDKAKTEFVSLASHQLRTPLSAIGWYVEMLLSGDAGKLAAPQIEYLKEIQHGSKRLVDMVNSLLNVSRIELGTFMVEPTPTKPVEIAEAVLGEVKALIEKKHMTLERQFAKDIPILKLDQHLLQIILQNLISNSIKYTPEKGKIVVSLGMKDDMLGIKVADNGIGIPKDQQTHIFEKLFRADNVRSTDTDGTGLGLYMVKQIVTEIGGTISFKSAAGKGTTMLVLLPATGMKRKAGTRRLS